MPSYDYVCKSCGETWEDFYRIDDRETPLKEACPKCKVMGHVDLQMAPLNIVSGVSGPASSLRVPDGFRDVMKKIKAAHPRHRIDGEFNS